jgi:glutaminyl-tRNA synthetase
MNTQKEINKYVKEKDENAAEILLKPIIENIKSIDNYSLITQTIIKNIKNDNNSLLFSNLILKYSDKALAKDIEQEPLTKLYSMSLKSQLAAVRFFAIQNLKKDSDNLKEFKNQLSDLKDNEKNEKVLELLNGLEI